MKNVLEKFEDLKGLTCTSVVRLDDEIIFMLLNGNRFHLYHEQDCCESVTIDDICGDLSDLENSEILMAEQVSNNENPEGVKIPEYQDSFTWTFYKLATIKGYVTIRWYGASNGYYSERVDFGPLVKIN